MIIAKFGGTSVAGREQILTIVDIVKHSLSRKPVLVVSAVSGITDLLFKKDVKLIREIHLRLINDLFSKEQRSEVINYIDAQLKKVEELSRKRNMTAKDLDELVSFGEIISSFIICEALKLYGIVAEQVIATKLIITDDNFQNAEFLPEETQKQVRSVLRPLINRKVVPVVTGFIGTTFIGSTKNGKTTTLGRGGSDYSASIIGYCLEAEEVQIWTDVDGIYTADPKVVPSARLIHEISYREASEMASFGAKVLHPRTIKPAIQKNIPVRVLNTFNPDGSGTLISANSKDKGLKATSFRRKITLVNIYSVDMLLARGFLARVFGIFAGKNISVDLVSVSEVSVSVTLDNIDKVSEVLEELEEFCTVSISSNFGIVSLVGEGVSTVPHIIRNLSELLDKNNIPIRMISLGASDTNISLVLDTNQIEGTLRLIHDQILLKDKPNVYNFTQVREAI